MTKNDVPRTGSEPDSDGAPEGLPRHVVTAFDKLLAVQRPAVIANIKAIRRLRPQATPAQVLQILEREYLTAVTTGGAAVGASAVFPGVGTGTALALSGVETAGFLEASALFAQSVAELHGLAVREPDRARALVMAMMLGEGGRKLVKQFAGQMSGKAAIGRPAFWGELVTTSLPQTIMGPLTDSLKKRFMRSFLTRQSGTVIGRMVPFGIGAVIGGAGNHLLGRRVITSSREAFPPLPQDFLPELALTVKTTARGLEPGEDEPKKWSPFRRKPRAIETSNASGDDGDGRA
jgi:hypothetical protein